MKKFVFIFFIFLVSSAFGQRQLLLLKGERVMHRFLAGDYVYIKVKNDPVRYHTYINNILEDALVLGESDTITYRSIERTYTNQRKPLSSVGKILVQVGVGIFLIDQFNTVVVQKEKATLDHGITTFSAVCVAVGLPLMLIKKKGEAVGGKLKLYPVDERSPFYQK